MLTIAETLIAHTPVGGTTELPRAGTTLENPFAYDAVAREIKQQAERGCVAVVDEWLAPAGSERLIRRFAFKRLC